MSTQEFFNRLIDSKEKSDLLKSLVETRTEIRVKIVGQDKAHTTQAFELCDYWLSCFLPKTIKKEDVTHGHVICNFSLHREIYFMESDYKIVGQNMLIELPKNIFRLQRRDHFRVEIPGKMKAFLEITMADKKPFQMRASIIDLSAGGCRINLDAKMAANALSAKSEILGDLHLLDNNPIPVSGNVRRLIPPTSSNQPFVAGIQFSNITEKHQNRVAAIVMDIYREIFLKRK